jgi:hypothetical protein
MSRIVDDPRVANPGDDDLDLHLSGLLITGYVLLAAGPDAAEFAVDFDPSIATGWWADPVSGSRFWPERITRVSSAFGIVGARAIRNVAFRLELWQQQGRLVAWTAAPGKFSLWCAPGVPAYRILITPRGMPDGGWPPASAGT